MQPESPAQNAMRQLQQRALTESMMHVLATQATLLPRQSDMDADDMLAALFQRVMVVYDSNPAFRLVITPMLALIDQAPEDTLGDTVFATMVMLGSFGAWDLPGDSVTDYCTALCDAMEAP